MLLFIIGAIIGSFLNVCIHRLPRGGSIITPASHCPKCGRPLNVLDLIPIVSYIVLRGKCRSCGAPISIRYPVVEIMTGLLFMAAAWLYPPLTQPIDLIFSLVFISLLIAIFFIDLEDQVIPDSLSVTGIAAGLLFNLIKGPLNYFISALAGMVVAYLLFFLIAALGKRMFKKEAMGEGDLFLAAMLGAYLGWEEALLAIMLAYILAAIVALFFMAIRKVKMGEVVPFGPALAAGGVLALFFGQQILSWYKGSFF